MIAADFPGMGHPMRGIQRFDRTSASKRRLLLAFVAAFCKALLSAVENWRKMPGFSHRGDEYAFMKQKQDRMATGEGPHTERIRLFRSGLLERLTVISPRAFAVTWLAVLALVLFESWGTARIPASIGLPLLGLLIWTLFEYAMHRFVFHMKPRSDFGRWLVFLTHGNHHAMPGDPYRNLMPPVVSLPILGAFWVVFVLLLGPAGSLAFLGFAMGYVGYDSVHYACHQFPMRGPVLRQLRRHHIRHHYARHEGNYAITAILWDRVLGTDIPAKGR